MIIKNKKYLKGFTLIELLLVIAILGLLASIIMVNLSKARANSRDAKRVVEARQMVKALEAYYLDNDQYPPYGYFDADDPGQNWLYVLEDLYQEGYLDAQYSEIQDSLYPDRKYEYLASSDIQDFRIRVHLENLDNPVLSGSMDGLFFASDEPGGLPGSWACDSSLGYYCVGMKDSFYPLIEPD